MTKPTIDERWMEWIQNGFISKTVTRGQSFRTIFHIFCCLSYNFSLGNTKSNQEEEERFGKTKDIYAA